MAEPNSTRSLRPHEETTAPARRPPSAARRALRLLGLLLLLALAGAAFWFRDWVLPGAPPVQAGPLAGLRLEVAFPQLTFERPVFLTTAPGSDDLYVVEQAGSVRRFSNRRDVGQSQLVLDLRERVSRRGNEEGLLGLAFHPGYAENGRVFVYYSARGRQSRSVLAELGRRPDGLISSASERVLLEVPQPWRNHNGGMLTFGPDGKLYLGLGDGGSAGDPQQNGQDPSTLLGTILRLDVDRKDAGLPYAIPPDNPFVTGGVTGGVGAGPAGARGEVWAYGLRNPWRFSFDRETGELWAGDVGQNAWEEVDLIVRGGNYGWRRFEGFALYDPDTRAPDAIPPLAAYDRREGFSITGGVVYRGADLPELRGWYLYADYATGAVWALRQEQGAPAQEGHHVTAPGVRVIKLLSDGPPIASFGEDAAGEVNVCAFDGRIHRLVRPRQEAR